MSVEGGDREGDGRWRRRREELLADRLVAQVEWKGMCLDIRGMIVARSDCTFRQTETFLWLHGGLG